MQYKFTTEAPYPVSFGVERYWSTTPDENGLVEVPEDHERYDEIVARCDSLERLERIEKGDTTESEDPERDPLAGLTEEQVVTMDSQEIRGVASDHPDLDGRKGADELEEKIIMKLRGEE